MTFSIKNLGRINHAEIDIKPLTLFIGKNDSGKTYCASAIWAIINFIKNPANQLKNKKIINFIDEFFNEKTKKETKKTSINLTKEEIRRINNGIKRKISLKNKDIIKNSIGINQINDGFIQYNPKNSKFEEIKITLSSEQITKKTEGIENVEIIINYSLYLDEVKVKSGYYSGSVSISLLKNYIKREIIADTNGFSFFGENWTKLRNTTYIPAARTGIMLAIDYFISASMKKSSFSLFDIRSTKEPIMPGPIMDFANKLGDPLIRFRSSRVNKENPLTPILPGKYTYSDSSGYQYTPENLDHPIPLAASSSLVTELAGFSLLIEGKNSGSCIIFEEPEAHLHLEAQREMAKILAKLVNQGNILIITTHSDTFLQQINNLITLHDHPNSELLMQELDISKKQTIDRNIACAYDFQCEDGVTIANKIKIQKTGFAAQSINEVLIKLTEETYRINEGI